MERLIFITILLTVTFNGVAQEIVDTIASQELHEVIVKGEKPLIKGHDGIMTVDLPSIVKDKPVSNVLEALGYLPGVMNTNGMISLAGASEVTIILNGIPTNMPVSNLYQMLYSTPVERLKNVEIMYTAPAKYHVSGAVINVVLKTPTPLDGLQAQARLGYIQQYYGSYGGVLSSVYAIKKWHFDMNYSLTRGDSRSRELSYSNHLLDGTRTMIDDDMRRISKTWRNNIYTSLGYDFSEKSKLLLIYNGQITSYSDANSYSNGTLGSWINNYDYHNPVGYHNVAIRYGSPFGMTVGGDYTNYYEHRTQHLISILNGNENVVASNRQRINRWHGYMDLEHDIKGWILGYGVEFQHSDDNSSQQYLTPEQTGFNGTLKEDVANTYVGVKHTFPFGLSFNASAKGEYFHNNHTLNWNFIPQFGATFYKNPKHILQLDLSTNRAYPEYWELRGGSSYINEYSEILGNPLLQPYINYSGQFSYILKQKYVATLYVQYGDKATVQLPYQSPDELKLIYQTINLNYKSVVGLNISAPFNIGYVWNANATANIFHQREKADKFHDISFDNKKWVFYGSLMNSIRFTQNCPVALSIDFTYISPSLQGIADLSHLWKLDAGVKWQFGRKLSCELDLKADDIFNRWSPVMTINHTGQNYRMDVRDMTRSLNLTFTYRFNGFKPKDITIDTSRFGTGK